MAEQWQVDDRTSAQIKDDDDDAPDDWEAELEEKPKPITTDQKPKSTTIQNKGTKNKTVNDDSSKKIIHEPDGDYTPEQMDEIEKKGELQKEHTKIDMAAELVDKEGPRQSLDNISLVNRDEFLNYSLRLSSHLDVLAKSEFYLDFLENFLNGITKSMSVDAVKHLQTTLQMINLRKQSEEREKKSKSKTKKHARPQLKTSRRTDYVAFGDDDQDFDHDDDYDDDLM